MPRLPYFKDATKLTLHGERADIAEAHIYASRQRKSLSQMFFDWLRPLIGDDKAANPEAYGDRQEVTTPEAK